MVQPVHNIHQPDGVHIIDSGRVRIIAELGRVAGEAENIFEPDRRGAQQIALNAEHVSVAAGVVQEGLDPGLLLDLNAEALRAHAGRSARRVGHVDGVNTQVGHLLRALELFRAVDSARRNNLNHRDKCALVHQLAHARALLDGRGRCLGHNRFLPGSPLAGRCLRFGRPHRRLHCPNVLRRRPAAASQELHAGLGEFAREARHVLR